MSAGRSKGAGSGGQKVEEAVREERKMMAIMRQIEQMEHKEKAGKAGGGHGNEKVGEKRLSREACDTGGGEKRAAQGPRDEGQEARSSKTRGRKKGGAGGEKLENKGKKETNHTQDRRHGKTCQEQDDKDQGRKELIGAKILKEFPPYGIFEGVIKHIRRTQGAQNAQFVFPNGTQTRVMYHVVYEDGDSEDLLLSQVLPLLAQASAAQGQVRGDFDEQKLSSREGKEEAVKKRTRPWSAAANKAKKQQCGDGVGATHLPNDSTCPEPQVAPQRAPIAPAPPAVKGAAGRAEEADTAEKCVVEKSLESAISGVRHCRVKRDARLPAGWRSGGREGGVLHMRLGVCGRAVLARASHARPAPSPPLPCSPSASFAAEALAPTRTTSYPCMSSRKAAGGDTRGPDVTIPEILISVPGVRDKRNARDTPDTDDDGTCPGRSKGAGAVGQKVEEAGMRSKKLSLSKELSHLGQPRNLSREERKMMAIMRRIEEMEHKEKSGKAGGGHGNEKVGEKRRSREACDTGGGEVARQQQQGSGGGGEGAGGGALKTKRGKCPHNRHKSECKQCGGSSICEHNRRRCQCKQCGGASICEHNRQRNSCKQCGGSSICEHNRLRHQCKLCGGASICEHNRMRSQCKPCGGSSICEHNRRRSECKQCGGASICEHNRRRSKCKQCVRSSICKHNRPKKRVQAKRRVEHLRAQPPKKQV